MQEETIKLTDLYSWLESNNPKRKVTEMQIIESIIDLSHSCFSEIEVVYNILVKYREVFTV